MNKTTKADPEGTCTRKDCNPDFEAELRRLRVEMGCPFGHKGNA